MRRLAPIAFLAGCLASSSALADWQSFDARSGLSAALPQAPLLRVLRSDRTTLRIEAIVPGALAFPEAVEGRDMVRLVLPGGSATRDAGRPEVPYLSRLIATRGAGARVRVLEVDETTLDGVRIAPAARKPMRCGGGTAEVACDARFYGADAEGPSDWARLEAQGSFRGQPVARLVVSPVRYNPARGTARVARRLLLEVDLGTPSGTAHDRLASPSFESVLRRLVLNHQPMRDGVAHEPERILVLAHDSLLEAIQPLVDWKVREGLPTKVVPLSTIGTTPNATQVKAFLAAEYASEARPAYVLLVGDSGLVPYFKGDDGCASDWMYTQLDGDDLYSDVIISRISAKTADEVAVQVAKVLFFESDPPGEVDGTWLPKAAFISSSQGDGASSDDVRCNTLAKMFADYGYAPVDKFYNSKNTDKASSITAALNDGRGFLAYLGHGSGTSWSTTSPEYTSEIVKTIQNPFRLPLVMDVSCLNGQFADPQDCFAETWMKIGTPDAPRGAVGIYSSSTETAWDQPAEMAIGVAEGMLSKGKHRWGETTLYGRSYLIDKMGSGSDVELVFQQYVMFGDASMRVRTRVPSELAVGLPGVLPVGSIDLVVTVADGAVPVADALVSLRKEGDWSGAAYTDANGNAAFEVSTASPGALDVLVTAFDHAPWTGTVQVAVTGCGVVQARPAVQNCDGAVTVTVWDADLVTDPSKVETVTVQAGAEPGITVPLVLSETAPGSGQFQADVRLADLSAKHGSALSLTYQDAACEGATRTVAAAVAADCQGPAITGVAVTDVIATAATVSFATDEPATAVVFYGPHGDVEAASVALPRGTAHKVRLEKLANDAAYQVRIEATDVAGNVTVAGGGGEYGFTTPFCTPDCTGKKCGDDGCGGSCGGCEADQECQDGRCFGGKGCTVKYAPGWSGAKCEACVCKKMDWCCSWAWDEYCVELCDTQCGGCGSKCVPQCTGKKCGPNGCGGQCGVCGVGQQCSAEGQCVCKPQCDGVACGDDGCGGQCGQCAEGTVCTGGQCVCAPACDGKACGDDGCGGQCGQCDEGEACTAEGQCACQPKCDGKACGDDGCGGQCGTCTAPKTCTAEGQCACTPACDGKACGDDGCGGSCGACPEGQACAADPADAARRVCTATAPGPDAQDPDATPAIGEEVSKTGGASSCAAGAAGAAPWAALLPLLLALGGLRWRRRENLT